MAEKTYAGAEGTDLEMTISSPSFHVSSSTLCCLSEVFAMRDVVDGRYERSEAVVLYAR